MTIHQAIKEEQRFLEDRYTPLLESLPEDTASYVWRYEIEPEFKLVVATGTRKPDEPVPSRWLETWTPQEGFTSYREWSGNPDDLQATDWRLDVVLKSRYSTVECLVIRAGLVDIYKRYREFRMSGGLSCIYSKR